jgi:CheY-like chemotaxis protein
MTAAAGKPRLKVLYIEDNVSNLLLLKRIFRDRDGIVLLTAARGQEGLDMARAEIPGLILLDLHLPDMLGVEVLQALREDPVTAAIPVVAVSADATQDQITHLHQNGVVDYVTKPFEVPRLLAVVDAFVPGERVAPADSDAPTARQPEPVDAVLDHTQVAELLGLDRDGDTFRALVATALDEAAKQIATIAAPSPDGADPAAVRAAAHGLKSSAAIIGARRLASLAGAVELAARAGSLPDAATVAELGHALAVTKQATTDMSGAS